MPIGPVLEGVITVDLGSLEDLTHMQLPIWTVQTARRRIASVQHPYEVVKPLHRLGQNPTITRTGSIPFKVPLQPGVTEIFVHGDASTAREIYSIGGIYLVETVHSGESGSRLVRCTLSHVRCRHEGAP